MRLAIITLQNAIRLIGLFLIVLGFLFWAKQALNLVSLHMRLGVTEVVLLWAMALLALRARVSTGLVIGALLWGLLTAAFGMKMGSLLPGRAHELIRVLHFLIGLGAIGLAESLAARAKRSKRLATA
jgi:uncharacterized membrane protein YuzA (DUF378 family)